MQYEILLVVPRYNQTNLPNYNYYFPLGLGYISSTLKRGGHKVETLNLNHLEGSSEDIVRKALDSVQYDFVCTGNTALGFKETESILTAVQNHRTRPETILGGIIVTAEPEIACNALRPTFAVIGEGEQTVTELLDHLHQGLDISNVSGIAYFGDHGNLIKTPQRAPIKNLDLLPIPDFEGFGFGEHLDNNMHPNLTRIGCLLDYPRIYPILASRSCPFHCTFCYHDSGYRKRNIENVVAELNLNVKAYKINLITLYDECFSIDKKRVLAFCEGIKSIQREITWDLKWYCQMRVESVDRELLKIMRDAGCGTISYGFESFSPVVLKSMKKHITPNKIDKAFQNTLAENIAVIGNFIFGDVAETKETAATTLNYWKNNCKGQISLSNIIAYPGSMLFEHCVNKGLIKDKLDFIKNISNPDYYGYNLNMTDKMSDAELSDLRNLIQNLPYQYRKTSIPLSIEETGENLFSYKVKCPYCNNLNEYHNCYLVNKKKYQYNFICKNCSHWFYVMDPFHQFVALAISKFSTVAKLFYLYRGLRTFVNSKV